MKNPLQLISDFIDDNEAGGISINDYVLVELKSGEDIFGFLKNISTLGIRVLTPKGDVFIPHTSYYLCAKTINEAEKKV